MDIKETERVEIPKSKSKDIRLLLLYLKLEYYTSDSFGFSSLPILPSRLMASR